MRYADDFVVLARHQGDLLVSWIEQTLEERMELTVNRAKTRVVNLKTPGESVDFLGYTFRYFRDLHGREHRYLNVYPSKKALARERQRLREMTSSHMCFMPIPDMIAWINRHLAGWPTTSASDTPACQAPYQPLRLYASRHTPAAAEPAPLPSSEGCQLLQHLIDLCLQQL